MRIVHLIPGSGGTFYCENCLRDAALVQALRALGHDVVMVPLYLPMFVDTPDLPGDVPVFFGGINVYLQQQFSLFRKTPRWLDRFFDMPWMLKQAAAREGSTSAADLGPMTLSMLQGRDGRQQKELARLITWLRDHERPDLVHISNALLLGLAPELKKVLGVPVLCSLQDEDTWLDAMSEPHATACWEAMGDAAQHVDAFVSVSEWYAGQMCARMGLRSEQIFVIPLGITIEGDAHTAVEHRPPVLGYLTRLCETQGLGRLADAFVHLKETPELRDLCLRATGGITPADETFLKGLWAKFGRSGVESDVEFVEDFQKKARHEFLKSLSVLSVPVPKGEAFGTFILEALAQGVPVVQPAVGAFPEVIEATGGGLIYDPEEEGALEKALSELLLDPARAHDLGQRGQAAVRANFTIDGMAAKLLDLYHRIASENVS